MTDLPEEVGTVSVFSLLGISFGLHPWDIPWDITWDNSQWEKILFVVPSSDRYVPYLMSILRPPLDSSLYTLSGGRVLQYFSLLY